MPETTVVLGISIVLISLVIGANWLAGGWQPARIEDSAAALARLRLDYPDFTAVQVLISNDKCSALLAGATGHDFGLITAMGDTLVTRVIGPDDITRVHVETDTAPPRLLIDLADFSLRHAEVTSIDRDELDSWQRLLSNYHTTGEAA